MQVQFQCVRVAIISDVHANLVALDTVLGVIDDMGIERIICSGDIVGYYPFPNQVIDRFREREIESILGNHDRATIDINTVGMNRLAAAAIRWTTANITSHNIDYLKGLGNSMHVRINDTTVALYHGSPRDDDEYLYEADLFPELLEMSGSEVLIVGHTHMPYVRNLGEGTIINPGSVGQPRDGDARASFAVINMETNIVEIKRVEYDIDRVMSAVEGKNLPLFLGERLQHGF